jgi:hypothetical protein
MVEKVHTFTLRLNYGQCGTEIIFETLSPNFI